MLKTLSRSLLVVAGSCLVWPYTELLQAQQVADSTFSTKVDHPSYTSSHPKVLVDEAHFNFHTTTGRYKPLADVITSDGYEVTPNRERFSRTTLKSYDILMIANAQDSLGTDNPAFTEDECDAAENWVNEGGSLLLIADHMPWGAAAANLANRFSVEMRNSFTVDIDTANYNTEFAEIFKVGFGGPGQGDLVFSCENGLIGNHPIVQGRDVKERINRVISFIGQSLAGPDGSVSFLKLANTACDVLRSGERLPAAGRAQGIALKFGKGRVVVLGEAAMLSAQLVGITKMGMNYPGFDNRQLALNIMHWLSKLL